MLRSQLGSHSIFVNYCNILAYFHIMNNKVKAALTVLKTNTEESSNQVHMQVIVTCKLVARPSYHPVFHHFNI